MHHNIPKLLSPIASDAHVHHFRQHSGKIPKLVTHPLIRGVGDGRAEGRLRGGKLRHGDRRRDEEKRTRREETTQTPPKLHSLTVSASCPTSDTHHNASRQSISTLPSTLPHRISHITPGDPSDWDSQNLSREEDNMLQHRLYVYSDWSGELERRRQSGADANDRESRRNSTPKPDLGRNTRNAPNEAPP